MIKPKSKFQIEIILKGKLTNKRTQILELKLRLFQFWPWYFVLLILGLIDSAWTRKAFQMNELDIAIDVNVLT